MNAVMGVECTCWSCFGILFRVGCTRGLGAGTMHRTETIDYALILSGEITMLLDDEEVLLKAGDVVVQCGTNHAWSNRSNTPCLVAFILIDGEFDPQIETKFETALAST
jgi:hypothetical protein